MTRWKYMTMRFPTAGLGVDAVQERRHAEMTLMGEYGWELVSTNVYHDADAGGDVVLLFFKKPADPAPGSRR